MTRYEPSPDLRAWLDAEGFVDEGGDQWVKTFGHTSGMEHVTFILYPWDGKGGFSGESYEIVFRLHASGTNPRMGIGTAHSLNQIRAIFDAVKSLSYENHQGWIASRTDRPALQPKEDQ